MDATVISVNDLPKHLRDESKKDLIFYMELGHQLFHKSRLAIDPQIVDDCQFVAAKSSASSASIGIAGEKYVEELLRQKCHVESVRSKGRCGDLIVKRGTNSSNGEQLIMIEVKKYGTTVQYKEIEKFYRDLDANAHFEAGVFISLTSKISGISETIQFCTYKQRPVLFLQSNNEILIQTSIDLIFAMVDHGNVSLLDRLYSKISKLNDQLNQLSLARTHINETRIVLNKQLDKIYETIFVSELQINKTLKSIKKITLKKNETEVHNGVTLNANSLETICADKTTFFAKNKPHQKLICEIFGLILGNVGSECEFEYVQPFKKTFVVQNILKLKFFKSKTEISTLPKKNENGYVTIPKGFIFDGEWLQFTVDKTYMKSGLHEKVVNFYKK